MSSGRIARISLRVESLRQAENLYTRLFGLTVGCREGIQEEEQDCELPGSLTWEEIAARDITLHRSVLYSDGFCLTLHRNTSDASLGGRIDRIGLSLEPEEFRRLWRQVEELGCYIEEAADRWIVFNDPYGIRWEILTEAVQAQ